MPKLRIDNREVEVAPGTTILQARAATLGIDIPTLCHWEGCTPQTSCLVCLVKINNSPRLMPSCATPAQEGMEIESETPEVHAARKAAIELLLAEHAGDCFAPCENVCPAHMDIPSMMRHIEGGDLRAAVETVRRAIPLPATLGRICPELCEKGCRRNQQDSSVSICSLKRYVGDKDLESATPWLPPLPPFTGKRIAIIGSGPAGLTAAWFLRLHGHAVVVHDDHPLPGGALRYAIDEERLPRKILDAEIGLMRNLGVQFLMNVRIGKDLFLADLQRDFDAVLLAVGPVDKERAAALGVNFVGKGIKVDRDTMRTSLTKVFAAGSALIPANYAIRAVADGKSAAESIHEFLSAPPSASEPATPDSIKNQQSKIKNPDPFASRLGKMSDTELAAWFTDLPQTPRLAPATPRTGKSAGDRFSDEQAVREASRCGHCDCAKVDNCRLRTLATRYQANANAYRGARRSFHRQITHPHIIYESGKCILCGLCVDIAARAAEPLGLTFIGRGFSVEVGVPLHEKLSLALQRVARECAAACPTGAIALRADLPAIDSTTTFRQIRLPLPQLRS